MIWRICSNEIDPSPLKIRFFDILDTTEKKTHLHLTLSTEACAADRHRWDYYEVTATVAWPSHKKFHQYNITSNHGFPRLSRRYSAVIIIGNYGMECYYVFVVDPATGGQKPIWEHFAAESMEYIEIFQQAGRERLTEWALKPVLDSALDEYIVNRVGHLSWIQGPL